MMLEELPAETIPMAESKNFNSYTESLNKA